MSVQIDCPECAGAMTVEEPGTTVACPHCGVHVPTSTSAGVNGSDRGRAGSGGSALDDEATTPGREGSPGDSFSNLAAIQAAAFEAFLEHPTEPVPEPHSSGGDRADRPRGGQPEPFVDVESADEEATIPVSTDRSSPPRRDDDVTLELTPAQLAAEERADRAFTPTAVVGSTPAEPRDEDAETVEWRPPEPAVRSDEGKSTSPAHIGEEETIDFEPSRSPVRAAGVEAAAPAIFEGASAGEAARVRTSTGTGRSAHSRDAESAAMVPRSWFVLALSYGSLVTLLLLGLLFDVRNGGRIYRWLDPPPHQLESLPDIVKREDLRIVPEDADLAPGHVLSIGDVRRFGDLRLEVLRVTREPVRLEERDVLGEVIRTYEDSEPVLHLWLEFENLSDSTPIVPLDRELLLASGLTKTSSEPRSNQFVCQVDERQLGGDLVRPYWIGSSHFAGQSLGEPIPPGESRTLYVPCEERGVESLEGELVWRLQFRKGYGPNSGKGVTTLVDVRFHSDDVVDRTRPQPDA